MNKVATPGVYSVPALKMAGLPLWMKMCGREEFGPSAPALRKIALHNLTEIIQIDSEIGRSVGKHTPSLPLRIDLSFLLFDSGQFHMNSKLMKREANAIYRFVYLFANTCLFIIKLLFTNSESILPQTCVSDSSSVCSHRAPGSKYDIYLFNIFTSLKIF